MKEISPYITFDGNCREAMTFYKDCLGAELQLVSFGDMPHALRGGVPDGMKDRIMHARLFKGPIALMASDNMPDMPFQKGNNFSVSVLPESLEETDRLWNSFSQGATISQKLDDAPWGARFGMLTDQFGITWMFNFEYPR
jgi:PhnB protein